MQRVALLVLLVTACREAEITDPAAESSTAKTSSTEPGVAEPIWLTQGEEIEFELEPGALLRFRLRAASGDFIRLTVEQDEIDVITRLFDPSGEEVIDADSNIGDSGPDPLLALIEDGGEYALEIKAPESGGSGFFSLWLDPLGPPSEPDCLAAERFRTLRQAVSLAKAESLSKAMIDYQWVIEASKAAADGELWSEAMVRLAYAHMQRRELDETRRYLSEVAETGGSLWRLKALDTLAYLDLNARRPRPTIESVEAALAMPEVKKLPFRRARLYFFLGRARQLEGSIQHALDAYRRALDLFRPWDGVNRAHVLQNLGALYRHNLGRPREALSFFEQAVEAFRGLERKASLAAALNQTGACFEALGESECEAPGESDCVVQARMAYSEALELRRELGSRCAEASTLIRLALLDVAAEPVDEAAKLASAARDIIEGESCVHGQLAIRLRLAAFAELRGDLGVARDDFHQSLIVARESGNRQAELEALVGLARICRRAESCPKSSLELTGKALAIIEDTRSGLAQEDHRLAFGSRTQALFDLRIDLQWDENKRAAFETAEKARARAFLDRLRQIDADVGSSANSDLLDEARRLREELRWNEAEQRRREFQGNFPSEERESLRTESDALVARLDEVVAEIGRIHPEYYRLMRAQPAELAAVQSLLDPTTALIVYRLGEGRSYLWLVTETALHGFPLPSREKIEDQVDRSRKRLESAGSLPWSPQVLESLVVQILPEAALPHLAGRHRWMVVADGALEFLPFAVLPDPSAELKAPLLVEHEIVYLPSASAWVELRSRPELPVAQKWLALVADPVYGIDDERLPSSVRQTRALDSDDPRRLPGSGREAEAIRALLPGDSHKTFLSGFEATRNAVLDGELRDHRIVHLSVHGEFHRRQPALSNLAFAMLNRKGQPLDGRLYAHELYGLRLPADLVVLAGCETGLGPLIPGEGLVSGLSRGFLYAGARRVMVSLWPISDTETPKFMTGFYDSLFHGEDPGPVAALHTTQLKLYHSDAPLHAWAGFVLQGD